MEEVGGKKRGGRCACTGVLKDGMVGHYVGGWSGK